MLYFLLGYILLPFFLSVTICGAPSMSQIWTLFGCGDPIVNKMDRKKTLYLLSLYSSWEKKHNKKNKILP